MRVLVCRPQADAEATAARLAAAGHDALIAPVLAIEPRPVTLPSTPVDALIVTSRHAFAGLADADAARLKDRPLFAVGDATARAARARGFSDIRIGQGDAAALGDLLALTLEPGVRLLYLVGEVRKDALAEVLHRRGDVVALCEAYSARPCVSWPDAIRAALREGTVQAALHFSRRSADLALTASIVAGVGDAFAALGHACLSPDVAAPLRARGLRVVVAAAPTEDSLLQALAFTLF